MKVEAPRPGVFRTTMTTHELSALVAAARMSLSLMESDQSDSTERARQTLRTVLEDFDAALRSSTRG
jgi:hypothetical protein